MRAGFGGCVGASRWIGHPRCRWSDTRVPPPTVDTVSCKTVCPQLRGWLVLPGAFAGPRIDHPILFAGARAARGIFVHIDIAGIRDAIANGRRGGMSVPSGIPA